MSERVANLLKRGGSDTDSIYLGMEVPVSLTGTAGSAPSNSSYVMQVCYFNKDKSEIHLMGKYYLSKANWSTAKAYRWTATGTIAGKTFTVADCAISTLEQICKYTCGYYRDLKNDPSGAVYRYWLPDESGLYVLYDGRVHSYLDVSDLNGVIPRVVITF